jgi:hypothetical protein
VLPTARNARGVDIIAYNADASRTISVQVAALSKRNAVPLGSSLDKVMGDFWVIINNAVREPTAYVMLPSEVRRLASRNEKNGRVSFWLDPPRYDQDRYKEAWERLGRGGLDD